MDAAPGYVSVGSCRTSSSSLPHTLCGDKLCWLPQVENTSSYRYGFIIKVFNIDLERLEGKLDPTGMLPGGKAIFTVTYDAIVFKPFKKEVLSGIVTTEQKQGLFVQCGPLRVSLSFQPRP